MKQKGLGRGLDAIFGSDPVDAKLKPMSQMAEIEIADIIPNPTQPRTQFDEEALDELADSIRQLGVIQPVTVKKGDGGKYVIILSGDQICKQDYADFLRFHKEKNAEFSVAVMEVPWSEAPRFGLMVTDENDRISEFQEKPKNPKSNLASMGIYIFNWDILKKYLTEDENDPNSENDFGKNVIPALLRDNRRMYAYRFSGYWKDVGTISSLWQANMEVLDPTHSGINLFDENWKIYSRNSGRPCQRIGTDADIVNSMITEGCQVDGTVKNSILFPGVVVEKGATVEAAVVMGGTVIKAGAKVEHCIVAENVTIEEGATVGKMPESGLNITEPGDVATVGSGVKIGKGATVGPKAMISNDVKDGEEQW
mgnify:CR=1 FL=1